jgi:hypothetical protein
MLPLAQTAAYGGPALDIMHASPEHRLVTLGFMMFEVDGVAVLEAVAGDKILARYHAHANVVVTAARVRATSGRVRALREQLGAPFVPNSFAPQQLLDVAEEAERHYQVSS